MSQQEHLYYCIFIDLAAWLFTFFQDEQMSQQNHQCESNSHNTV